MCHCEKCGKDFRRPNLGPRKVLKSGIFQDVYDLQVKYMFTEYGMYIDYYYFTRNLYCPKCGAFYDEMNSSWAWRLGEIAPRHAITRYFEYCRDNGLMTEDFLKKNDYPGSPAS